MSYVSSFPLSCKVDYPTNQSNVIIHDPLLKDLFHEDFFFYMGILEVAIAFSLGLEH